MAGPVDDVPGIVDGPHGERVLTGRKRDGCGPCPRAGRRSNPFRAVGAHLNDVAGCQCSRVGALDRLTGDVGDVVSRRAGVLAQAGHLCNGRRIATTTTPTAATPTAAGARIERRVRGQIGRAGHGGRAGRDLPRGEAIDRIVADRAGDRGGIRQEARARASGHVVDDDIALDEQARAGIGRALAAVVDDGGIVGILPLLDDVVADDADAAIGQIDAVAGRAAPVVDARIGDGGGQRTALDLVTDIGVVEVAVVDDQRGDLVDIEVVRIAIAGAVVGEFRPDDADRAGGRTVRQEAVLVVEEVAVDDDQVAAFVADARAVPVGYGCTGETQVLDRDVALGDEDALAVGWRNGGDEVRHAADTDDRDVLRDRREVVHIGAGLHGDDIAVVRGGDRSGKRCVGLAGPDIESCHEFSP